MPLRDRVRRALNRPIVRRTNRKGVKIEYFHRNEVPRSKFRGPFDPEHQQHLEKWSFGAAMAPRPRSPDLSLSPCTSVPHHLRPEESDQQCGQQQHQNPCQSWSTTPEDDEDIAPDQPERVHSQPSQSVGVDPDVMDSKSYLLVGRPRENIADDLRCLATPTVTQIEDADGRGRQAPDGGSQSSTMVDFDSFNGSVMTLLPDNHRPDSASNKKESVRYTSPAIRTASPLPKAKGTYMPFSPDDLTRALNAVQIY